MSKEQQPIVNDELTDKINNAYIGSNYALLNGGDEKFVMITGSKEEKEGEVNILLTLEGLLEIAKKLEEDAK